MLRSTTCEIILKALGVLLIVAALLKGHQLMTEPVVDRNIWSYRPFLIFQVESELALGIWLSSKLFGRIAWFVAVLCFGLFCCVTFYKALTGTASCGCFGKVHVNPWITLAVIDLPAVVALLTFRPRSTIAYLRSSAATVLRTLRLLWRALHRVGGMTGARHSHFTFVLRRLVSPTPHRRLQITVSVIVAAMTVSTPILAVVKPTKVTSTYEVLEPNTWIGKELLILDHIDIANQLELGNWLVVLYHHGCPDCRTVIPEYKRMAEDLQGSDFLRIALVEVPPYRTVITQHDVAWIWGQLDKSKQWFVVTPAAMIVVDGHVRAVYGQKVPDIARILSDAVATEKYTIQIRHR